MPRGAQYIKRVPVISSEFFQLTFSHGFILVDAPNWHPRIPMDDTVFPHLRASMIQDLDHQKALREHDDPPRHTIERRIFRNTSLPTISSILKYPLDWSLMTAKAVEVWFWEFVQ